jgi:prepilin-type N-terminal cleavage/methylation domain-containing protein
MLLRRSPGFSIIELLISIAILGVLSTGGYLTLQGARNADELQTAVRVLANDLRSMQSMALSTTNVRICDLAIGGTGVCVTTTAGCNGGTCTPRPPAAVGVRLTTGSGSYTLYGKTDGTSDLRYASAREVIEVRDLAGSGAQNVRVQSFTTVPGAAAANPMNIAFLRQSGSMKINQCGTCTAATELVVALRHTVTGQLARVRLNVVTGRISSDQ